MIQFFGIRITSYPFETTWWYTLDSFCICPASHLIDRFTKTRLRLDLDLLIVMSSQLRVGYVPEHFSTPLHFANEHYGATFELQSFPSGTGAMISALQSRTIDLAIGLTEGWIAGLARAAASGEPPPYALIGTYVESPLRWAVSTGTNRKDVAQEQDPGEWLKGLVGKKMGVSRVGSGSYVMGFVMADKLGQLEPERKEPFEVVVLETFEKLRQGVNSEEADFFMWEHFTSKKYFENGKIRNIGEIMTPWPSWHIVSAPDIAEAELDSFLSSVDRGIEHFNKNPKEAVQYISTNLDYSKADAEGWLKTVQFATGVKGAKPSVVDQTLGVLKKARVIDDTATRDGMVKFEKKEGLLSALSG